MKCRRCRDKGFTGGCPACGKDINQHHTEVSEPLSVEEQDLLYIPKFYTNVEWDSSVLASLNQDLKDHRTFTTYLSQLDLAYNIFKQGDIPNQSLLVVAPPCRGKQIWAYSCMRQAKLHGYTVTPLIDSSEWRRLNIIATEKAYLKDTKMYGASIEDFCCADIVFMTVDLDNFKGAYRAIQTLVDKRQRRDKPTIIISRFSPDKLSLLDFDGTFKYSFRKNNSLNYNSLKQLGLIVGE